MCNHSRIFVTLHGVVRFGFFSRKYYIKKAFFCWRHFQVNITCKGAFILGILKNISDLSNNFFSENAHGKLI